MFEGINQVHPLGIILAYIFIIEERMNMNKNLKTIIILTSFILMGFAALMAEGTEIQIGTSYILDGFNHQFINGKVAVYYNVVDNFGIGMVLSVCKDVNGDKPYFLDAISLKLFFIYLNLGISDQVLQSTERVTYKPHAFSPVLTIGAGIPLMAKDDSAVALDVNADVYCVDRKLNTADHDWVEMLGANIKIGIGITYSFGL
jgi:hypothetical protein